MTERTLLYLCTQLWGERNPPFDEIAFFFFLHTLVMIDCRKFKRATLQIIGPD